MGLYCYLWRFIVINIMEAGQWWKIQKAFGIMVIIVEGHIGKKITMNKSRNCKCFLLNGTEVLKQPLSRRRKTYFDQFMKGIMTQLPTLGRGLIQWSKKFCLVTLFLPVHCSGNSKVVCVGFHSRLRSNKKTLGVNFGAGKVSRIPLKL